MTNPVIHPAIKMEFSDLVSGLEQAVSDGYVAKRTSGDLSIYNYTHKCTMDGAWNEYTTVARGLIVNDRRIVALPFPKFFNLNESHCNPPSGIGYQISEKMDGSLGIVYWHNGWHVATRGSFDSDQAKWAENWLHNQDDDGGDTAYRTLDHHVTYLVEIVYNANRIVIDYPFEGLVLLAAYRTDTGEEIVASKTMAAQLFYAPAMFYVDIDYALKTAKTLPADQEGFVIKWGNGYRAKIKGAEYIRIHRAIHNVTPLAIWDMLRCCDDVGKLRGELPEEHTDRFDEILKEMRSRESFARYEINGAVLMVDGKTNKEIGMMINNPDGCILSDMQQRLIFSARRGDDFTVPGKARDSMFRFFKPVGNVL